MIAPNDVLGYYRMIERIGAGGMGEVWKAEDTRLGRVVAIKILPPAVASDQEAIARMRREARTAAQINSPHIATIYAFEEIGERLFIVMEYVEGEPLTKFIARGVTEADLCRIGRDVAEALSEAHAKGIIHRDIKPDNVIVSGRRVKVLDFGIAKQVSGVAGSNDPTAFVTQQGMIIGTVQYMSPEQALGKSLDARTDIFSLGVVLYQMATGRLPFRGETVTETMTQIIRDEPPDPTTINRALSPGLTAIIARCLRKPREQRFDSAAEVAAALDAQLAKSTTAPMTSGAGSAAPTVLTAPQPAPKKKSYAWVGWVTAVIIGVVVAIAVSMRQHRVQPASAPAVTTTRAAVAPAPATTSVTVTVAPEPSPPKIVETKTTTAAAKPPALKKVAVVPEPKPAEKPNVDQLYSEGMTELLESHPVKARKAFESITETDPHNAKAHFRLGELKLMTRDGAGARDEFKTAIDDQDRLDPRERKLAHLGLAITNKNWDHAKELGEEIYAANPNDPDLGAFRRFLQREQRLHEQGGQHPFRGRRRTD
ncbi:MAG TPA: protein kinase [Thermoanaerobaculia bacterium]